MGGFVVDNRGLEATVPDVNVYEPGARRWSRGKDIPVPVDSAVTGVVRDRFIYLIGGRSAGHPVNNVQIYDVERDSWSSSHAIPRHPRIRYGRRSGGRSDRGVDGAKPGPQDGPRYVPPTNAGWARLIIKIPQGFNGASYRRIPARLGSESPLAAQTGIIEFIFPAAPPHLTITRALRMTASLPRFPASLSTSICTGISGKRSTRTRMILAPMAAAFWIRRLVL